MPGVAVQGPAAPAPRVAEGAAWLPAGRVTKGEGIPVQAEAKHNVGGVNVDTPKLFI